MRAWQAVPVFLALGGLCLLAPTRAIAAEAPRSQVIDIDWCHTPTQANETCEFRVAPIPRIDADASVVLHVRHFNFVAYGLEYRVEETVVEAYQALDKLWSQLLGLPFLSPPLLTVAAEPLSPFATRLREWNARLIKTTEDLESQIAALRAEGPAIPDKVLTGIKAHQDTFRESRRRLEEDREKTASYLETATLEEQGQYKSVRAAHGGVLEALDSFDASATLTREGQRKSLGTKKGGTRVSVSLAPRGVGSERKQLEYFVHSSFPVLFHAGYAFSALEASAFEKVRTVAGNDLFSQIEAQAASTDLTAFLSYEFKSWGEGRNGVSLGLGTGVRSPGDTLFAVASLRFKRRVFLSGGIGSNVVQEGTDPVAAEVAEQLGLRELFAAITTRRQWRGFVAVSFSPF